MAITGLSTNPTFLNTKVSTQFWSSKLLNYVEPIEIGGFIKTVFYTEKNCNFNVGDRVFIVNGNYDSDLQIRKEKWAKYTDGWRVLGCDKCRVILDIDYTGITPFASSDPDNFIQVHHIRTQREFDWINHHDIVIESFDAKDAVSGNSLYTFVDGIYSKFSGLILVDSELSTDGLGNPLITSINKVHLIGNSIIWVPNAFNGSLDPLNANSGVGGSGFYMRQFPTGSWINITSYIQNNYITSANPNFTWNRNLLILNENFNDLSVDFIERCPYEFDNGSWEINISYKSSYISKNNFRSGLFKGNHNDGIFGTYEKVNEFDGAIWKSGVFLNSTWLSGIIDTKSKPDQDTFISKLGTTSSVSESPDLTNNGGFGWTYFIDSDVQTATIQGGVFENCNIGVPAGLDSIGGYYGETQSYPVEVNFGKIKFCDVVSVEGKNTTIQNSIVNSSHFETTKFVNSQVTETVIDKNSEWNDKSGIQIVSAAIWSYWDNNTPSQNRGILKLFINDSDYEKLKYGGVFYISNLNKDTILTNLEEDLKILLPIETKWFLDFYYNSSLPNVDGKIIVSIKSALDNSYRVQAESSVLGTSNKTRFDRVGLSSIDIDCANFGWYTRLSPRATIYTQDYLLGPIKVNNVSEVFENCYLNDAEFGSGVFNKSTWISGDHVNYHFNNIIDTSRFFVIDPQTLLLTFPLENLWDSDGFNVLEGKDLITKSWVWIPPHVEGFQPVTPFTFSDCFNYLGQVGLSFSAWPGLTSGDTISISKDNPLAHPQYIGTATIIGIGPGLTPNVILDIPFGIDYPNESGIATKIESKSIGGPYRVISTQISNLNKFIYLRSVDGLTFSSNFTFGPNELSPSYISISQILIDNSTIVSGLFKRTHVLNSTYKNIEFDNNSRNLTFENISKLRIVNSFFDSTKNIVENGLVYKSHFLNDKWNSGIFYNSIWFGGEFRSGSLRRSYWKGGTFSSGFFGYSSAAQPTSYSEFSNYDYDTNSNYMNWNDGNFLNGEFYQSVWSKGSFFNGRLYYSDFYSGRFINGILGSDLISENFTKFGYYTPLPISTTSSVFVNGVVDNAIIGGFGDVYWMNGKFKKGTVTTEGNGITIWNNGDFLGGKVTNNVRWKDGKFYGGKFLSTWNWNLIPLSFGTITQYAWQGGEFFGGEFGNGGLTANSNWYDGEFKGGIFRGRIWQNGVIDSGVFLGSGTHSIHTSPISPTEEQKWLNSFDLEFYGLWVSGNVVDDISSWKSGIRVETPPRRKIDERRLEKRVLFQNILWIGGTFSHEKGTFLNSVWIGGTFEKGTFDSSIFNAYVDRTFANNLYNLTFAGTQSCRWLGGEFKSTLGTGSFYHSEWMGGNFRDGYMMGSVWRGGTFWYGKADNVYWEKGRWKNGTWNGTPFDRGSLYDPSDDDFIDPLTTQINSNIGRENDAVVFISDVTQNDYIHVNNVFSASTPVEILSDPNVTSFNPTGSFYWSEAYIETYQIQVASTLSGRPIFDQGQESGWTYGTTMSINTGILTDSHVYTYGGTVPAQSPVSATPPSTKLWAAINGGIDIFDTSDAVYFIQLRVAVDNSQTVTFEIGVGNSEIRTIDLNSSIDGSQYSAVYDLTFTYQPTQEMLDQVGDNGLNGRQLYIKKTSFGNLRILSISIQRQFIEYNSIHNNTRLNAVNHVLNAVIFPLDPTISARGVADNGAIISLKWGNGRFKEGVWENGVWNDGWRSNEWFDESDIILSDGILGIDGLSGNNVTYQTDPVSWLIKLRCLNDDGTGLYNDLSSLTSGDLVAIGNIVAIDVNENRKLIKDPLRVVNVDVTNNVLTVSYVTNFPIRRVVTDSKNHLIYITKNIWLNGVFLNGYFKGVWNGGMIKGYPQITKIENSHMIDGKFDGGHFVSTEGNLTLGSYKFNTGLVQNFNFIDNNVADINKKKYLSWMDINYMTFSRTNLNKDSTIFKIVPLANGTASFFVNERNLWGEPTVDVLKSISSFRDIDSNTIRNYSLGQNLKKYSNLLSDDGNFLKPFSSNLSQIGLDNFTNDPLDLTNPGLGWNLNNYINSPTINSNVDPDTSRKFKISTIDQVLWTRFENVNITDGVLPNRYYMVEADLDFRTYDWLTASPPFPGGFTAFTPALQGNSLATLGWTQPRTILVATPFDDSQVLWIWGGDPNVVGYSVQNFPYTTLRLTSEVDPDSVWGVSTYSCPTASVSQQFKFEFDIEFPFPIEPSQQNYFSLRVSTIGEEAIRRGYTFPLTSIQIESLRQSLRRGRRDYLPYQGRLANKIYFRQSDIPNLTSNVNKTRWRGSITTDMIGLYESSLIYASGATALSLSYRPLFEYDEVNIALNIVASASTILQAFQGLPYGVEVLPTSTNAFTFSGTFSNIISSTVSVSVIPGITVSNILTFDSFDEGTALSALYGGYTPSTTLGYNHLTDNQRFKREYFFNKSNLEMTTFHSNQNPLYYFGNISFFEVDMIPFFKYADESEIDFKIKSPYYASAPRIDYNNTNFDFVGNVSITIDSQTILSEQIGFGVGVGIPPIQVPSTSLPIEYPVV